MDKRQIGTDVSQVEITSLSHIQGQQQVKELLKTSIDAYFQNRSTNPNTTFGTVLLLAPPGTGKTVIARTIHYELGNLTLIESNGEMLNDIHELMSILIMANSDTSIFIDECQALSNKAQHILLTALSERKLYIPKGRSNNRMEIPLAPFLMIMASTHEFELQEALRNRARIVCRLDYYPNDILTDIVRRRADALGWKYESVQVLEEISKRSKKTPRLALHRNLQTAWNVCSSNGRSVITLDDAYRAFELLQIDSLGLDVLERAYLKELAAHPVRKLNILSSVLGLPRQTISSVIEPYLLRIGLIDKDNSDRRITDKGMAHLMSQEPLADNKKSD